MLIRIQSTRVAAKDWFMPRVALTLTVFALFLTALVGTAGSAAATGPSPGREPSDPDTLLLQEMRTAGKERRWADAESLAVAIGAKWRPTASSADSLILAEMLETRARARLEQGRWREPGTMDLAGLALALRRRHSSREDLGVAGAAHTLGRLLRRAGHYEEAREHLRMTVRILEAELGTNHPETAKAWGNLGVVLNDLGDVEAGLDAYHRTLAIFERLQGPEGEEVAGGLYNIALALEAQGEPAAALPYAERLLAVRQKRHGADGILTAEALHLMAMLLYAMGDYEEAEPLSRRALRIREDSLSADATSLGHSVTMLANILRARGDRAGARPLYERALAIDEAAVGRDHPRVLVSLINLGALRLIDGDLRAADEIFRRGLAIAEKSLGALHPHVAMVLSQLGTVARESGRVEEAMGFYRRALAIREETLGPDHPDVAGTLYSMALLLERMDRRTEAIASALRAEEIGRRHLRLTMQGLPERQAMRYSDVRVKGLDLALEILAREESLTEAYGPREELARRVWDSVILSRAVVLDELARRQALLESREPATQRARQRLAEASRSLAHFMVKGSGGAAPERLQAARSEREQAEKELAALTSGRVDPSFVRDPDLAAIHAALPEEAALVAFVRYETGGSGQERGEEAAGLKAEKAVRLDAEEAAGSDAEEAATAYLAFVLSPRHESNPTKRSHNRSAGPPEDQPNVAVVSLGDGREIDELVRGWRETVGRLPPADPAAAARAEASAREAGSALRAAVWAPIVPLVGEARRILIVPDGALCLVPFGALPEAAGGYLAESDVVLHLLTTERDLLAPPAADQGEGLLALGGPDFDVRSARFEARGGRAATGGAVGAPAGLAASPLYRGQADPFNSRPNCPEFATVRFSALPFSEEEARAVARVWKGHSPGPASVLAGGAASEARFKREAEGRLCLHLATHGFFIGEDCAVEGVRPAPDAGEEPRHAVGGASPQVAGESSTDHAGARGIGGLRPARSSVLPPDQRPNAPPAEQSSAASARRTSAEPRENPLHLSGLALAGANHRQEIDGTGEDGILTAEEIAAMDLKGVQWAVLSACDTGLGSFIPGEGVLGLRRAFQVAGVRSVIMSMWAIHDESARTWMEHFYRGRWNQGRDTAEAAWEASRALLRARRARGESDHPFYWAGFTAAGDWR